MKQEWKNWKKEDARSARKGWAPGDYLNTCVKCEAAFIGEKRAYHCADCAYEPEICQACEGSGFV